MHTIINITLTSKVFGCHCKHEWEEQLESCFGQMRPKSDNLAMHTISSALGLFVAGSLKAVMKIDAVNSAKL